MRRSLILPHSSLTAALGLCSSELYVASWGWPIHSPSGRSISSISAHSGKTFASACVPEILLSPHSHSSGFALQPPTHTCESHSRGIGFIITGLKAFSWTQTMGSKREEGKRLGVHKLSAYPLLLPAFSADEFLGKIPCALFLEWMISLVMAFVVGGCNNLPLHIIYLNSWWHRKIITLPDFMQQLMIRIRCWKISGSDIKERMQFIFKEAYLLPSCVRIKCPFLYWSSLQL